MNFEGWKVSPKLMQTQCLDNAQQALEPGNPVGALIVGIGISGILYRYKGD